MSNFTDASAMAAPKNQFYPGPRLSFAVGSAVCDAADELNLAWRAADDAMYAAKCAHIALQRRPIVAAPKIVCCSSVRS